MESNERVEVIIELFREGHAPEQIADLLGYKGKGGVSGYMRRHGYRWDWSLKNYVRDPSMLPMESDIPSHNVTKTSNQMPVEVTKEKQLQETERHFIQNQEVASEEKSLQEVETVLKEQKADAIKSNVVSMERRKEESTEASQAKGGLAQLTPELLRGLQEILASYSNPATIATDQPLLRMKRYRGPLVNKTVQIQTQLSERLTGFVNNSGYTVKDVMNKAVEEFLERYGG